MEDAPGWPLSRAIASDGIGSNGAPCLTPLPISALKRNGLLRSLASGGSESPTEAEEASAEERAARQQWDALEDFLPAAVECPAPLPLISFNEALQHFQTSDLRLQLESIQPTLPRSGLTALTHFLFGPPRLHTHLVPERDLVFAIAQCRLDSEQLVHMRVLQTIYRTLMRSASDCPRYGPHWESLGFQGADPATDLRGTGFLALMHTLALVMDPEKLPLAREIFRLSKHPVQNFPFSVMSINVSRIALHALREEVLSRECNRRQQVVAVVNDFYLATFLHLFQLWRSQRRTIHDSGQLLKEVEQLAKRKPRQMLRSLQGYLTERRAEAETRFTGVCEAESDGEDQLL